MRVTIFFRGSFARNEQSDPGITSHFMFGYCTTVLMVICIVTMQDLSSSTRSDVEDDCVHQLWEADALFDFVTNLQTVIACSIE